MSGTSGIDAEEAFVGTLEPQGVDRLDEGRLVAWLENNVPEFRGPIRLTKFKGGQSNPTYKIEAQSGDYVLRRKPFGALLPSAHAVDREFKVQSCLASAGFPVAPQYGLCTDDAVIGSWFYVMGMVRGRTIWNGAMPGSTPTSRVETYHAMIDTLAQLHSIDVEAVGLSSFGKPGNYFKRQVDRWTKQYRLSETDRLETIERLIEWLPATCPEQTRTAIVHGDFRIDNMIFSSECSDVIAVLDWELSTIGDPLADFAYFAMSWVTENGNGSGVMDLNRRELGIPDLPEVVERYCVATGRSELPGLDWYFAYNFFRLAGIVQGIKKRSIDGTASSAHAEVMSERVSFYAGKAWDFAVKAGA